MTLRITIWCGKDEDESNLLSGIDFSMVLEINAARKLNIYYYLVLRRQCKIITTQLDTK